MLLTLRLVSLVIAKDKNWFVIIFHFGNFKVYCVSFDLVHLYFFQDYYFILQNSFLSKQTPKLSFC